jgi:alpha-beta hydrolase superfamily lysophospholipase
MTFEEWTLPGHRGVELFARTWLPAGDVPRDVIVIAHGYAEHGARYGNLVDRLVPLGYAVHTVDHRGHGRSGGPRAMIDRLATVVDDFHRFVARVRDRHSEARVKLIGHSMGGAIAFNYALKHQADLSGLILSGPAIGGTVPWAQRFLLKAVSALAPSMGMVTLPAEGVSRDPAVVSAYASDPLVYRGKVPARTAAELIDATSASAARAGAITVPTLIQHGTGDVLISADGNAMVYAAIGASDKTVRLYDGLAHEIYNEPERDQVIADLVAWLEQHPAA